LAPPPSSLGPRPPGAACLLPGAGDGAGVTAQHAGREAADIDAGFYFAGHILSFHFRELLDEPRRFVPGHVFLFVGGDYDIFGTNQIHYAIQGHDAQDEQMAGFMRPHRIEDDETDD